VGSGGGGQVSSGVAVELTIPFFRHYLYMSGIKTIGLQNLYFGLALLGLVAALCYRRWQAALLAGLWMVVPFVAWSTAMAPRRFEERYVIFVTPVLFLLAGQVTVAAGDVAGRLARRWNRRAVGGITTALLVLGLAGFFVTPLQTYYALNRQEDRLDQTLVVVERHARDGDIVLVSPRFFTRPLDVAGAEVLYLTDHLSLAEVDRLAQNCSRLWLLYTSYLPAAETQEPFDRWVQGHADAFLRVPIKAVNVLAWGTLTQQDEEAILKGRAAILEDLVQGAAGQAEERQRYGMLAEAYHSLANLYEGQGQAALAEEYRAKEEAARAAASAP
jgi:uncharacterized membrane protein YhaH (DUF805 family)